MMWAVGFDSDDFFLLDLVQGPFFLFMLDALPPPHRDWTFAMIPLFVT